MSKAKRMLTGLLLFSFLVVITGFLNISFNKPFFYYGNYGYFKMGVILFITLFSFYVAEDNKINWWKKNE
ncbi:hypothetical protein P7H75_10065 [Vagococcus carniphilus]|uniref:hypothetical protein n=1 Tax=Vagococcus carniphilus TaxID=218144 RepID=UPI00288C8CB8|nr:hypothetical protein [Vagococcus carniphilus]MDT2815194.1 hypothetical protein [Vagococcus carniphilus]